MGAGSGVLLCDVLVAVTLPRTWVEITVVHLCVNILAPHMDALIGSGRIHEQSA
jgi:hypothetical protein